MSLKSLETHEFGKIRQHFELIPFGAGRRTCPGISFGLQVVHLSLASFLHAFEFPTDQNALINLSECLGLTSMKAKPLQVLVDPSLSSKAYASYLFYVYPPEIVCRFANIKDK
ncbi:Cytochrome P450 82A4 [Bienertia sinuspersici]